MGWLEAEAGKLTLEFMLEPEAELDDNVPPLGVAIVLVVLFDFPY